MQNHLSIPNSEKPTARRGSEEFNSYSEGINTIRSSYHDVWRRAMWKIKIRKMINYMNEEILVFGTSNTILDSISSFKSNADQILYSLRGDTFRKVEKLKTSTSRFPSYLIHPKSRWKKLWDAFLFILLLYTAIVTPFYVAFIDVYFWDWLSIMELIIDCTFEIDIFVNLLSASYRADGIVEKSFKKNAKKYLTGWFWFDLTTSLPFTLVSYAVESKAHGSTNHYMRIARLPRLYKIIRATRMAKIMKHYKNNMFVEKLQDFLQMNSRMFKLTKFVISICISVHIMGCVWFMIDNFQDFPYNSWVFERNMINTPVFQQYLNAVYWALVTVTTVGYGDIHAYSPTEQCVSMAWMFVGIGFYSVTIGSLASCFADIDTKNSVLEAKLGAIHEFSKSTGISDECKQKIRRAIKFNSSKSGNIWNDKHGLLQELGKDLRYEICLSMYDGAAREIPFFSDKDKAFVISFMPLLKPMKLSNEEFLYSEGNYAGEVVFIIKGKLNLVLKPSNLAYKSFLKGSYFGEIEILKKKPIRKMNVRSYGTTELLVISRMDFLDVFAEFREDLKHLKYIANERERKIKTAKEKAEDVLRKSNRLPPSYTSGKNPKDEEVKETDYYQEIKNNIFKVQKYLKTFNVKMAVIESDMNKAQEALRSIQTLPEELREKYIKILNEKLAEIID